MRLAKNSLYTLLSTALPTVISVVTIPLFVSEIGAARYGALAIAWLVLGYFGTADFGIGRAITQRVASMRGEPQSATATAIWTAVLSVLAYGLVSAVILFGFAHWYFTEAFVVEEGLRSEIVSAVWALALCNPLVAINGVLAGSLMGMERFKLVSLSNTLANSAIQIFPLLTAYFLTVDLTALILAAMAARAMGVVILSAGLWRSVLRSHAITYSSSEMKHLAGFGAWIMVTAIVGPMMTIADRFVIGVVEDAAAVAAYAIPFQLASRTGLIPQAVVQALFPRFASDSPDQSLQRCRQFSAFIGLMFAPIILLLIGLAEPLLSLWLGDELDPRSIAVAQIVLAGFWVNAIAGVSLALLQARGNPRFTALLHLSELPIFAILLFTLGQNFGLAGFAAAFSLRCLLDCIALAVRARVVSKDVLISLAMPAGLIALALALAPLTLALPVQLTLGFGLPAFAGLCLLLAMPVALRSELTRIPALGPLLQRFLRW